MAVYRRTTLAALMVAAGCGLAVAEDVRVRVRGTITSVQPGSLTVKTAAGAEAVIEMPDAATVASTKPFTMADVKPGMVLGVTTIKRADGATVALEVHPIPATVPQGLLPWDLAPNSTMTNATVEATVASANGPELSLNYQTGTVKVLVLPETAMAQAAPGTRADLKAGETVFVFGTKDAAGKITAARVQVSKDGIKPVQ